MLNRRHIRLKIMQLIYALKISDFDYNSTTEKQLFKSLEDIYDLYLILISIIIEVQIKAESYLKIAQQKHLATSDDKNPSKKFINNKTILLIRSNKLIQGELKKRKLNVWKLDNEYVDVIFNDLIKSELYLDYLSSSSDDFSSDKIFVVSFFKKIIATNEKLYNYLEDKNITWSDDFPVVNTSIVKMLNKSNMDSPDSYFIPTLFKD